MIRLTATAACVLLLAGCASFSPDGGFSKVSDLTKERTGQIAIWQRSQEDTDSANGRVSELLKQPLTSDTAVEIALLHNRGLQASFYQLGIAESDLVRAGRLANPLLSFGHLSAGGITEIDRSVMFNVLGLLTMPMAKQAQQRRFEQAQYQAAFQAVGVAAETRRAFFGAVAAQDLTRYFEQVKRAAEVSNELARRMVLAGNFSKLAQMRQQAFYADATSQLARARQQATAERERLTRMLGLSGEQLSFKLPERLPDLPEAPTEPKDAEQTAMDKRLDILMATRATEATARQLGLTKATGLVNLLEIGYDNKSQTGESRQNRDEVVPLKKRISDENLLRYNGMLIDVFELLADSREQVMSVTGYVEALRDFWVAQTNLQTAMTGRSPGASIGSGSTVPQAADSGAASH
jgi:outer membrane protein TolC